MIVENWVPILTSGTWSAVLSVHESAQYLHTAPIDHIEILHVSFQFVSHQLGNNNGSYGTGAL